MKFRIRILFTNSNRSIKVLFYPFLFHYTTNKNKFHRVIIG